MSEQPKAEPKKGADRKSPEADGDVNERPLTAKDKEAPTAKSPREQEGANMHLEQTRGNVFGDTTASGSGLPGNNPNNNIPGLHGRDGGFSDGSPNNPAPIEDQVDPDATKDGDAKGEAEKGVRTL